MTAPRLYGLSEVADAIGVAPEIVAVWRQRGKLPPPDVVLRMGPVWTARTIEPWIRRTNEERPAATAADERAERRGRREGP